VDGAGASPEKFGPQRHQAVQLTARSNVFIERLWRTVKYEEVYLKAYESLSDARAQLKVFLDRYNDFRPHQALTNCTPDAVYFAALAQRQRKAA